MLQILGFLGLSYLVIGLLTLVYLFFKDRIVRRDYLKSGFFKMVQLAFVGIIIWPLFWFMQYEIDRN